MRTIAVVLAASFLLGARAPDTIARTPEAEAKLDKLLAGRVAGEPRKCLPVYHTNDPIGIDDNTLLFRDGPRIWRTELSASLECGKIGKQSFLITESVANRICSGDQIDFSDGGIRGACVIGDFVPYDKQKN
jgi:hypothetical protein